MFDVFVEHREQTGYGSGFLKWKLLAGGLRTKREAAELCKCVLAGDANAVKIVERKAISKLEESEEHTGEPVQT